jgi:hypothetical protein
MIIKENVYLIFLYILITNRFMEASFLNQSMRNLLAKETMFCPKKHFRANQSCFMYFLIEENFTSSLKYCKHFSDSLVNIENALKWHELEYQLNLFNLTQYKFKIGLNLVNNKWKWLNNNDYNKNISNLIFCGNNQTNPKNIMKTNKCGHLVYLSKQWCIQLLSCDEKTKFICEWNLTNYKQYNSSLSILLRYTFLVLLIISLLLLIFLLFFLYEFIIKHRQYSILYFKQNKKFNLAYQKFKHKIK